MRTFRKLNSAEQRKIDSFISQQNLMRGVYSIRERKTSDPDQTISQALKFRNAMRKAFLKARVSLDADAFESFLDWHYEQLANRFPNYSSTPIGFDYLNGVFEGERISFEKEVAWIASLLSREQVLLSDFRKLACLIEERSLSADADGALKGLSNLTEKFGESMWSVQLRLGLEQVFNGLEAQKRFYESIRPTYKRGILAYVAYQTSVRNEDRTSIARFRDDLTPRIEARLSTELQSYLKYRLFGEWSSAPEQIADVLRVELSHSVVDIYETLIALAQESVRRSELAHLREPIRQALSALNIEDFRLIKLKAALGIPGDDLHSVALRSLDASDSIVTGRFRQTIHITAKCAASDPWLLIYGATARAHKSRYRKESTRPHPHLRALLEKILRRSTNCEQEIFELEKLCFNVSAFSAARAVYDFLRELKTSANEAPLRFFLVSLNCAYVGPEDFGLSPQSDIVLKQILADEFDRPSVQVWRSRLPDSPDAQYGDPGLVALASSVKAMEADNPAKAISLIEPFVRRNTSEALRNVSAALLIRAQMFLGDRSAVIKTIGDEGSRNPSRSSLLPIREALEHLEFSDYRALGNELTPLIALDMLWKETDDDKTASTLRFATSQFLRKVGAQPQRPSEFAEASSGFELHQVIYFLRYVCVPSIIDVSRVLKSTREVQEERQAICGVLNAIDPQNSEEYEAEIFTITHRLKVAEGLRIIDRNRIHVDTDAITRWAKRTISEEFSRYLDLVRAKIGVSENFDDVLKEALSLAKHPKQAFFTPENEADAVLLDLLTRLKDEFLHNSTHGLDYYLSKRVRHQSFVGLVRGPLEFNNIITTKITEHGDYRPNKYWLDRLNSLDEADLDQIDKLFRTFAEEFDQAIRNVKDSLFHVRSSDQPAGIFDIELTPPILMVARAVAAHDLTLDDFLKTAYALFWGALDTALSQARFVIADVLKMGASRGIDSLRAGIRHYAEHDPAFAELGVALGAASAEVQLALSEAETWFNRPEIEQASRRFSLKEALDVAIESALKLHRTFKPQITTNVVGAIDLHATDLVFITDAVFISFSNIKSYAGLVSPKVTIELIADLKNETLSIEINNDFSSSSRTASQESRLLEIKQMIEHGVVGKKVKKEGGTGFLKLSSVVNQSDRGKLEFGYTSDDRFRVFVCLSLIFAKEELAGDIA